MPQDSVVRISPEYGNEAEQDYLCIAYQLEVHHCLADSIEYDTSQTSNCMPGGENGR